MKRKRLEIITLAVVAVVNYCVGFIDGLFCIDWPIISVFLSFFPAVVTLIALIILKAIKQQIFKSEMEFLGEPITIKTEKGYTINSEDIHVAIEKLGYLEYEKEESDGIYGNN